MRRSLSFLLLTGVVSVAACSTSSAPTDAGGDAGPTDGSSPPDTGIDASPPDSGSDASPPDAGTDAPACKDAPIGRLCVRGVVEGGSATEELAAGGKVLFQIFPKGCHSSSCTTIHESRCAVQSVSADLVTLTGRFCLGSTGGTACTPDCSGGGFGACEHAGVAAGSYTAKLGALEVPFEVPSQLPPGGLCVGSPL